MKSPPRVLRYRLLLGATAIAIVSLLFWFDVGASRPGMILVPLALVAAWFAAGEMLRMFRASGAQPDELSVRLGTLLPVVFSCVPMLCSSNLEAVEWLVLGVAAGLLTCVAGETRLFEPWAPDNPSGTRRSSIRHLGLSSLSVLYVGGLIGFFVQLRLVTSPAWPHSGSLGLIALTSLIFTVKLSDVGQYSFGHLLGKTKLSVSLSPGKTWEGAVGGVLLSTVVSSLLLYECLSRWSTGGGPSWAVCLLYCFSLCMFGVLGDLTESLLKRDAGVKDSSDYLPGIGGVLDTLDSLLLSAPVALGWWLSGMMLPN